MVRLQRDSGASPLESRRLRVHRWHAQPPNGGATVGRIPRLEFHAPSRVDAGTGGAVLPKPLSRICADRSAAGNGQRILQKRYRCAVWRAVPFHRCGVQCAGFHLCTRNNRRAVCRRAIHGRPPLLSLCGQPASAQKPERLARGIWNVPGGWRHARIVDCRCWDVECK